MASKIKPSWYPCSYTNEEVGAIKALYRGDAMEHQQKIALAWIINTACGTYEPSMASSDQPDMIHHEGRRYVGNSIIKLTKTIVDKNKE